MKNKSVYSQDDEDFTRAARGGSEMTNESRIKLSDILVRAFLLGVITIGLTAVVYSAMTTFFVTFYWQNSIEQMLPFMLSLIVSLELVELILIMYLLYRRQGPVEEKRVE